MNDPTRDFFAGLSMKEKTMEAKTIAILKQYARQINGTGIHSLMRDVAECSQIPFHLSVAVTIEQNEEDQLSEAFYKILEQEDEAVKAALLCDLNLNQKPN